MGDIRLNIISPESTILDEMVDNVTLPGSVGPFMVLKNHAPIISSLEKGVIKYKIHDEIHSISIASGFVEVKSNVVMVCVEL